MTRDEWIESEELARRVVAVLNEILEADRFAIQGLLDIRVPCNSELANHPTVQVRGNGDPDTPRYAVGILGVLNGLAGIRASGNGYICAVYGVDCTECHTPTDKGDSIDDPCRACGAPLRLGQLQRFEVTDD